LGWIGVRSGRHSSSTARASSAPTNSTGPRSRAPDRGLDRPGVGASRATRPTGRRPR
jgi:hypothetical protein